MFLGKGFSHIVHTGITHEPEVAWPFTFGSLHKLGGTPV